MEHRNKPLDELSAEARAAVSEIAMKGTEDINQIVKLVQETEGSRYLVAQKFAQALTNGNQKLLFCLALLEPERAQDIISGMYNHHMEFFRKLGSSSCLIGALENLAEKRRIKQSTDLEQENEKLKRKSKNY